MNSFFKSISFKIGLFVLLILLTAVYNYFIDTNQSDTQKNLEAPAIDYFATNIKVTQYLTTGQVDYKMTAERLDHIKATDIAYLTQPTAHILKNPDHPWFIRSDNGEVGPNGDTVKLINNINGTQIDNQGKKQSFEIGQVKNTQDTTRYGQVMIYPDQKYATSQDYVIVRSESNQTSGVGVKAYFDTNKIEFLSCVQSQLIRGQNAKD